MSPPAIEDHAMGTLGCSSTCRLPRPTLILLPVRRRAAYLEDEAVCLVLSISGGEAVLALGGHIDLVASQCVADLAELLDLSLENLLEPLVLQLSTLHLLPQLCREKGVL